MNPLVGGLPQQCQDQGYFNLAAQTVATLTFGCLVFFSSAETRGNRRFPWNARRKYLCGTMPRAKGDDVSFLTAAEFSGCLCLSVGGNLN